MTDALTERIEPAAIREAGPVYAKVAGTFLKKDAISLNNRFYPAETVERVVRKAQKRLQTEGSIPIHQLVKHGAADTDESLQVVGRLTHVYMDGDYARYEGEIPNTAAGRDVATLVAGGFLNSVSLRAAPESSVVERGEMDGRALDIVRDFDLDGVDYTLYPGIRDDARVESITIFESVDPAAVRARTLDESLPGEAAAVARHWYDTVGEASRAGLLGNVTIARVQRDFLPLYEARFEKPGEYTAKDREKIPDEDFAGPNKTYPIVTQADVDDAARLIGHADDPEAVKRKIIAIAKRKGFDIPDAWKEDGDKAKESKMAASKADVREEDAATQHSHAHTHVGSNDDPWGPGGSYTHEHPHGHDAGAMATHDSAEAHRHAHTAEHARYARTPLVETGPSASPSSGAQAPVAADHGHTPRERATLALTALARALREAGLDAAGLQAAAQAAIALDPDVSALVEGFGGPVGQASGRVPMVEAGRAISQANYDKLAAAHDHIAECLGLECAPGAQSEGDGDGGASESRQIGRLTRLVEGLVQQQRAAGVAAPGAPAPAAPPREGAVTADPSIAQLAAAMAKLAQSQAAINDRVNQLADSVPAVAARVAEQASWRPQRKTQVAENRDAVVPGGGSDQTLRERLKDPRIPIEKRIKDAANALAAHAQDITVLQALGAFDDAETTPAGTAGTAG
ncbi:MAG TPA: hypothetical protein VFE42_20690 [Chloroflexota bacterium]|nr:hypothetical protein [Chloroflexota bacterium]HZS89896.1 hypothetical protein [Chloroflexota bacterium]